MGKIDQTLKKTRDLLKTYGVNQGSPILDKCLNAQAERVKGLVDKLGNGGAVVLGDPTGTGKTPVAIAAALVARERYQIETILILVPNEQVADIWQDRVKFFGDNNISVDVTRWKGKGNEVLWKGRGKIVISTLYHIRSRENSIPKPARPESILIIVDEAHRGGYQKQYTPAHNALSKIANNTKLLLVTATPFQIDVKAMTTMLSLTNNQKNQKHIQNIHKLGHSINELLKECHKHQDDLQDKATIPPKVDKAIERVKSHKPAAKNSLEAFILGGFDASVYGIKSMPTLKPNHVDLENEIVTFNVARCIPELSGNKIGRSMVQRELVSSSEAFWESAPVQSLTEEFVSLCKELKKRLGEAGEHPKVKATCDWIAKRHREGRHILVFCVFQKTQDTITAVLEKKLAKKNSVHAPKGGELSSEIKDRFRNKKAPPLVLIVTDRFSESIDLDGGNPCIVHYDLPWNPARLRQRHGRVIRISSNFMVPAAKDIFIPILNIETDRRQFNTVKGREKMGEHLLMGIDGSEPENPSKDPWLLPDVVLKRLYDETA